MLLELKNEKKSILKVIVVEFLLNEPFNFKVCSTPSILECHPPWSGVPNSLAKVWGSSLSRLWEEEETKIPEDSEEDQIKKT